MKAGDVYSIGKITRPHGLKGEVTLSFNHEAPADIASLEVLYLVQAGSLVPYFVDTISAKGAKAYVKLHEVDTLDGASGLSGFEVFLPKADRPEPGESEFYGDEVIGFEVTEGEGANLGAIQEVAQSGLQRLLVIRNGEKEILIPVNGPFITNVDREQKTITVDLPEGFLEI